MPSRNSFGTTTLASLQSNSLAGPASPSAFSVRSPSTPYIHVHVNVGAPQQVVVINRVISLRFAFALRATFITSYLPDRLHLRVRLICEAPASFDIFFSTFSTFLNFSTFLEAASRHNFFVI
jgi:hypothetical protein